MTLAFRNLNCWGVGRKPAVGVVAFALAASALSGCDKIPGTTAHKRQMAEKAIAATLYDPSAAQFRNAEILAVAKTDGTTSEAYCGEVNGKNRMGAYVGFRRAVASGAPPQVWIDPQSEVTEPQIAEDYATCYGGPYKLQWACDEAARKTQDVAAQKTFEDVWARLCTPVPVANR